jgi:putative acetyltransferase
MKIKVDDLSCSKIADLLQAHHEDMLIHSPVESVHALDISALKAPDVTFYSAWTDGELAGCGALKQIDPTHGEIKSMRTAAGHLRKGVAASILNRILEEAGRRNYQQLSLETGSMTAFIPARKMYQRFGFNECEPFADYVEDPYSIFMTKTI